MIASVVPVSGKPQKSAVLAALQTKNSALRQFFLVQRAIGWRVLRARVSLGENDG